MVFVSFEDNYADEFDVYGFSLYNKKEDFLLELYKTWLFEYLESGDCPEVEGYLEVHDVDFDDYFDKVTIKDLEPLIKKSNEYYKENPREFYFGTNEAIIYESFKEFKGCFKIKDITIEEYKSIKRIIGETYGVFPMDY